MLPAIDAQGMVDFLRTALRLNRHKVYDRGEAIAHWMTNDEVQVSICFIENKGVAESYNNGSLFANAAFVVDILDSEDVRLKVARVRIEYIQEGNHEGNLWYRMFMLYSPEGHKFELVQRTARFQ